MHSSGLFRLRRHIETQYGIPKKELHVEIKDTIFNIKNKIFISNNNFVFNIKYPVDVAPNNLFGATSTG